MAEPRLFRSALRSGEVLAIEPQAIDFSYLYTGPTPTDRTEEGLAIVTINGPLEHHKTYWWDSYEAIVERVELAMSGQDVVLLDQWQNGWAEGYEPIPAMPARAVVLCIDSPGGEAAGAGYAHRLLRKLSKKYRVPMYAYANETSASAAYELACACDEIWLPRTGTVGSIGVIATLFDRTKQNEQMGLNIELLTSGEYKADGHADRPITDPIRQRMQSRVDELAMTFWDIVAKARGRSINHIRGLQAGVFTGQEAVAVGIADGVAPYDRFLKNITSSLNTFDSLATEAA